MARTVKITRSYQATFRISQIKAGSASAQALAGFIRALAASDGPFDGATETLLPPSRPGFVRQVPGFGVWLTYDASDETLTLLAVRTT